MSIWFKKNLLESEEDSEIFSNDPVSPDAIPETPAAPHKVDPNVVVKRINLSDKLYANIIDFITYNIGNIDQITEIKEYQTKIHSLFDELAYEVSTEYNDAKGKGKTKINAREDSTLRKVNTIYRFFAYYIIKYDKQIVEWMDNLIKNGLFNDKSGIADINRSYNNIDIGFVFKLEPYELVPQNFYILNKDGAFNKTLSDFFSDSGDLVEHLARGPGLFNELSSMMVAFRTGISVDYNETAPDGKAIKHKLSIPVGNTEEIKEVIALMTRIDAIINQIISVDAIRNKFISDYKANLEKLNINQNQISEKLKKMTDAIKDGKINSVDDFKKLQSDYKRFSSTEKEKQELGERSARMATAYKYKIESILNNNRGNKNG